MKLPLGITTSKGRGSAISQERIINLFPEEAPKGSEAPVILRSTPGLASYLEVGAGPLRGVHVLKSFLIVISGEEVYLIDRDKNQAVLGVLPGEGPVQMVDNGTQVLALNSGNQGFLITESGVSSVASEGFTQANYITFLDGYFLHSVPDSAQFGISGLYDGSTWDPLDYATAEGLPDNLLAIQSVRGGLWLFGEESTEIWYNNGDADFPFIRISGAAMSIGCASKGSIATLEDTVYWLGDDGAIYRAEGYQPQRVSTHAIEKLISDQDLASCEATSYTQEGHAFYVISFKGLTLCFDSKTSSWHERKSFNLERWRVRACVNYRGLVLAADLINNKVHLLSLDAYDEAGEELRRIMYSPTIHADGARLFMPWLEINMECGIKQNEVEYPILSLNYSDDRGKTWSLEHQRSFGAIGETTHRVRLSRLGSFRRRVIKISVASPTPVTILSMIAEVNGGPNA